MKIEIGQRLPEAQLVEMGEDGPRTVRLSELLAGRKVVLFALPGAFTGPCSTVHLPSFIRTAKDFRDKGVEEIVCLSVNDPFVLKAWGEATGGTAAGIRFLGDSDGSFTRALGMDFTAPQLGLHGRSNRYALLLDDGVIAAAKIDEPGVCDASRGEQLLAEI
ncbi:redoxin family protein [Albidovulum sp.]